MQRRWQRIGAVIAVAGVVSVAASLGGDAAADGTSTDPSTQPTGTTPIAQLVAPGRAEMDTPYWRFKHNPKVRLLGLVVQRHVDANASMWGDDALDGFQEYGLYYRLSRDPTGRFWRHDDVRATVTVGDTVFHDGLAWRSVRGPFSNGASSVRREQCFSKDIYLPKADPRFAVGATVPIRVTLPRSRQRFERTVIVESGHDDPASATQSERASVEAIGCTPFPVTDQDRVDYHVTVPFFGRPLALSPGSLVHPH